jgi:hypothetical protein
VADRRPRASRRRPHEGGVTVARRPAEVAGLGRPETPQETADRKAAASRRRRANQTVFNLVVATVASLGIVLFLVLVVPRPDSQEIQTVDWRAVAEQTGSSEPLLAPTLPDDWAANDAQLRSVSQVPTWYIGFITPGPDSQFIALNQGLEANPTWQADVLREAAPTGETEIAGVSWTVYDQRTEAAPGNHAYALSAELDGDVVILHGTADDADFAALATAVVAETD